MIEKLQNRCVWKFDFKNNFSNAFVASESSFNSEIWTFNDPNIKEEEAKKQLACFVRTERKIYKLQVDSWNFRIKSPWWLN